MHLVIDIGASVVKESVVDTLEHREIRTLTNRAEIRLQLSSNGWRNKLVMLSEKAKDGCLKRLQVGLHLRMDPIEHHAGAD